MRAPTSPRVIQYRLGSRFTPGVIALLALYGASFLLSLIPRVRQVMETYLILRPEQALGRRPWELLTGPLLLTNFFPLLFLGLLLWSIGSAVEEQVGKRRLWLLAAGSSLVASLSAALVGRILPALHDRLAHVGSPRFARFLDALIPTTADQLVALDGGPVFMMVLLAFARLYPTLKVTMWGIGEPVSSRTLSYFFIGLGLVADVLRTQWPELGGAVGALVGTHLLLQRGGPSLLSRLRARFFPKRRKKPVAARTKSGIEVVVLDGGRAGQRSPYGSSSDSPKPRSSGGGRGGSKDRYLN